MVACAWAAALTIVFLPAGPPDGQAPNQHTQLKVHGVDMDIKMTAIVPLGRKA